MSQNWFAVEVRATKEAVEAVEFALNEANADGIEIDLLGKNQNEEIVSVVGYFTEKPDESFLQNWLASGLEIYELTEDSIVSTEIRAVENLDWLAEWKKHWRPTETENFIVAPTWSEIGETDKIILRIEPGMAFGTGTHETTRLCLQAIETNYKPEMSFFDVGTGTGILAVGVVKMQSKAQSPKPKVVWACDTDVDSIKIAGENAEINQVRDKINFFVGSISDKTPIFDFVAANVTADVIVPMLSLLLGKSAKILVLSGILEKQQNWVVSELEKFQISSSMFQVQTQGEWISILIKR